MGVRVTGMRELIVDLESLPERAAEEFPKIVSKGALNIKTDWRARWDAVKHAPSHIPHMVGGVGYDTDNAPPVWSATIGVAESNSQSPLAHLLEYGSIKNAPHPAGQESLDAEAPRLEKAVADLAEGLLDG